MQKNDKTAQALGWFSIGLGLTEVVATKALTGFFGMEKSNALVRGFGLREITAGAGLLTQSRTAPWLWARVGGDAMDLAALAAAMTPNNPKRRRVGAALTVVGAITLMDIAAALKAGHRDEGNGKADADAVAGRPTSYVCYSDAVEDIPKDEDKTIDGILASMHRTSGRTEKDYGHAVRVSHSKSHGVAVGELVVSDGLPEELRQGLFARPSRYPVVARMANAPGEILSDAVSTQTGLAIKILGVTGEMLPGHASQSTQDWVLDTGNRFGPANAKEFLATHLGLEHMPQVPDVLKVTASRVALATNKALHTVGGHIARLDVFGHPRIHPLAEAYFTQAPIRYGDYIAKLAAVPVSAPQKARENDILDTGKNENALRTATTNYLRGQDAVFELRVQLCTDLKSMPIENANTEWREDESPYRTVARLTFPRQEAYSDARKGYADDALSFCPSHSLAAHRPLGSIMRARMRVYPEMSSHRRTANGRPLAEPRSIEEVPA